MPADGDRDQVDTGDGDDDLEIAGHDAAHASDRRTLATTVVRTGRERHESAPETATSTTGRLRRGSDSVRSSTVDDTASSDCENDRRRQPPDTTITPGHRRSQPGRPRPAFEFTATEPDARHSRAARRAALAVRPPSRLDAARRGDHTFSVTATDQFGNMPTPTEATATFDVDLTPPHTSITSGPAATRSTPHADASSVRPRPGRVSVRVPASTTAAIIACSSPFTTPALPRRRHTFGSGRTDAAGNLDQTRAAR